MKRKQFEGKFKALMMKKGSERMINFGRFILNNAIIENYEASKFLYSKFAKGKASYNVFIRKAGEQESENLFLIVNRSEDFKTLKEKQIPLNISGSILKNPISHKILYVVDCEDKFEAMQ